MASNKSLKLLRGGLVEGSLPEPIDCGVRETDCAQLNSIDQLAHGAAAHGSSGRVCPHVLQESRFRSCAGRLQGPYSTVGASAVVFKIRNSEV